MGIQINGQTDTISATDGSLNIAGTVAVNVTGDATGLTGTPDITVGTVNASSAVISGDLTVNGTTTTLDTLLTEVDKLEVGANNTNVAVAITQSGSGDILRLYDSGTQVVTVKDGGLVGIGTNNPQEKLHVSGTSDFVVDTEASGLRFGSYGEYDIALVTGRNTSTGSSRLYIENGDGESLRITSGGNVGIGTTNPQAKLDIRGRVDIHNELKVVLDSTVLPEKNVARIVPLGDYGATGAQNWALRGAYQYASGINVNAVGGDLDLIKSFGGNTILATKTDNTPLGNVGIGVATPQGRLHISSGTSGDALLILESDTDNDEEGDNPQILFRQDGGNYWSAIGLGVNAGGAPISNCLVFANSVGADGGIIFQTGNVNGYTNATERLRVSSSGQVIFGSGGSLTAPTMYFSPDSGGGQFIKNTNSTNARTAFEFRNPNGTVGSIVTSASATAYNETSDYRLKENVVPLTGAIDRLNQLQVRRFNFIADPDTTVDGFLAHEAQEVVPESVTGEKTLLMKTVILNIKASTSLNWCLC